MITKFGKRFFTSCLAGMYSFNKQSIAIGIDSTTPTVNNTKLGFEFYRLPVSFGGIDIKLVSGNYEYYAIYKTTIPQDVAGIISEVGLYPSSRTSINNYDSKFIADFEDHLLWKDSSNANPTWHSSTTPATRIGSGMVRVDCLAGVTKEFKTTIPFVDIGGYSGNDTLLLAINQADANLDFINIRFYSSDTAYYEVSFDGADIDTGTGNKILTRSLSTMTSSGSPSPLISKVAIVVKAKAGGATAVYFDGLRISDEDTFDPTFGLIARSVVTPITKVSGRPLDIEYKVRVNF